MKHLAIFSEPKTIEKILQGNKTIEGRFSRKKNLPYAKIKKGDEIYLKESGGKILGKAMVDNVLFYDNLTPEILGKLRREYANELCMSDDFWEKHARSKYVTLIFIKKAEEFISSVKYRKRDRRSWLIIEK